MQHTSSALLDGVISAQAGVLVRVAGLFRALGCFHGGQLPESAFLPHHQAPSHHEGVCTRLQPVLGVMAGWQGRGPGGLQVGRASGPRGLLPAAGGPGAWGQSHKGTPSGPHVVMGLPSGTSTSLPPFRTVLGLFFNFIHLAFFIYSFYFGGFFLLISYFAALLSSNIHISGQCPL